MPERAYVLVLAMVVGIGVVGLVGGWWALFHQVRDVEVLAQFPCDGGTVEVRRVLLQTGHTPLSYPHAVVELGPLGGPAQQLLATQPMPGAWMAEHELPNRVPQTTGDPDALAWFIYAADPALFACLASRLDQLRTALGTVTQAEVVVWADDVGQVWPVFRAQDGVVVRVRRNGAVAVEEALDGGFASRWVGGLYRNAQGARVRVVTDDASVLEQARDAAGQTVFERFPATDGGRVTPEELETRLPRVPLEMPDSAPSP